jgi:hypothetical protein
MRTTRRGASWLVPLLLAAGCGDGDAGPARGDYFAQLQRVSETAQIQERGLRRDLRVRLEEAATFEDRMTVLTVYVDQSARLYEDVVAAVDRLDPPEELAAPQQAYLDAWRAQRDIAAGARDAGFASPDDILEALRTSFRGAEAETSARCDALQSAVAAAGSDVDLVCDGRLG